MLTYQMAFTNPCSCLAVQNQFSKRRSLCFKPLRVEASERAQARMLSGNDQKTGDSNREESKRCETHVSADFAAQAMRDAIANADGDVCAMARVCAVGFCDAFEQCFTSDDASSIFVVCGSGLNGLIGMQAAIELKSRGYEIAVYAVEKSKHISYSVMCAENNIDLYDFIPSTMEFNFQVVVDALLGTGFDGGDIRPNFWSVYEMLVSTRLAIASVDVPSGWDLKTGPRKIDVTADTFVKPEVLVSLGAPKLGSKMFAGGYHFVAGRHLAQQYFIDKGISVPLFPGKEANCVLLSSNPFRFQGDTGEMYGRPGQYNATLFTKNPRREWVDVEEDDELWDELD